MATESVLGGSLAWVSDIDKGACKVLAHRFPGVPNIGDMTTVDWTAVERVDVLEGGTPCQDLSHAGKRKGMSEGTRSNLWVTMREAIAVMRPSLVIWENVGGAYSAAADSELEPDTGLLGDGPGRPSLRALGRVLGDLASLGYDAEWHGIRAADVGAPHGRLRVFLVAYPKSGGWRGWSPELAGTSSDVAWDGEGSSTLLPTPRTSDTNGAGQHGQGGVDLRTAVSLLPTPRATDGTKGGPNQRGSSGDRMLPSAVTHLLPTPACNDMGEGPTKCASLRHRPSPPSVSGGPS
jgi:DNA (cytosine-5)-methyltransferase 1